MCQNNLENTHHPPPTKTHPSHTHAHTHKQTPTYPHYQTYIAKVTTYELEPYCMMLQARINNKHPNVVNVLSFQVLPQKPALFLNSKELTEILVCTDQIMALGDHDWTKDNLSKILLALKRLVMIYGPFAVSAQQIGKNDHQEIKVWISKNVEKCKVDTPVPTEKDVLRNLAYLIDKKNSELAFRINAARTIRQAIDSLHSIFLYNSPQKPQKNVEWADLHFNKNFFSSLSMKFQGNKTLNSPAAKNHSFNQHFEFPKTAKHEPKDRKFMSNHYSIFNSNTISRPQSKASNLFTNKGYIKHEDDSLKNNSETPHNYNKNYYVPNTSYEPSRSNSRHLTFTPLNRLGNSSRGEHFSQRLGSERTAQNEGLAANSLINNFDITIINNNYSNYINNFSENKKKQRSKSPAGKYPSFIHSKKQKAKSQGKSNKNSSFWMNSNKLNKNKSTTPYFFPQNKKPDSTHKEYILDSLEDSIPSFKRNNNTDSAKVETCAQTQIVRKDKKLYTFFNPNTKEKKQSIVTPKGNQTQTKFNFFKKMTPSNNNSRSNTTQFFPPKRYNLNNKSTELCHDEAVQKRFNSFAIDSHQEEDIASAIPTTKSMTIEQNTSISSKKLQLKKQLKMQFGNLFNIAETAQSPRCSYAQNVKNNDMPPSQSKTQLLKESILKEKIKQKNEAFAQLKKEALKVLTDF